MDCSSFRDQAQRRIVDLAEVGLHLLRDAEPRVELQRWSGPASDHAGSCDACMRFWRGLHRQVRLLGDLERVPAPEDLAGRVVAALNAGHREDRAAASVAALAKLEAPSALAGRLEHEFRVKAPAALDQMVEGELEGHETHGTWLGRTVRVRPALAGGSFPRAAQRAAGAALALGLVMWLALQGGATKSVAAKERLVADSVDYGFDIVQVSSLDEIPVDPALRKWITGFTGAVDLN